MAIDRNAFIAGLSTLNDRDQGGMSYTSGDYGRQKYDEYTGEPYLTTGRPAQLTVYGDRARWLYQLIQEGEELATALATPPLDNTGLDAATAPKACEKLCSWCAQNNIPCDRQTHSELRALASGDRS